MSKWFILCTQCGADAFYTDREPVSGHALTHDHVFNLDGSPTHKGQPIACPSCKKVFLPMTGKWIREVEDGTE